MNLFALHPSPMQSAMLMCDKHIGKMAVEGMQTIVSALLISGAPQEKMPLTSKGEPHRGGYRNHPLTLWAAESYINFLWLWNHTWALCDEFDIRFAKKHAVLEQLRDLQEAFVFADYIPMTGALSATPTMFERCFNQSQGKNLDLIDTDLWPCDHEAYREFYRRDKQTFAKWERGREEPLWWRKEE